MKKSLRNKLLILGACLALLGGAAGVWVLLHPASFVVQPWRAQQSVTGARFVFGPYPVDADMHRLKAEGITTIISLLNPQLPYEAALLDDEKERAARLGMRVLNFPMGSILGQRFGADYERNSRAAADAAIASPGTVYIHCYLGLHRAASVRDYLEQHAGQAATSEFDGSLEHGRSERQLANERAQGLYEQDDYAGALRELATVQPMDYAAYVLTGWVQLRRGENVLARDASAIELLAFIRRQGFARVQMPFGDTHLAELPDGPLVLVAAGTGMAQMHSLIEYCRAAGFTHPVHLYWGVRRPEDFYQLRHWDEWRRMPNLHLHRVVSDICDWGGRCGLLHEAIRQDFSDLKSLHVYASGSPAMVYGTLDALVEAGMDPHQMRADVFAYAPREG